MSAAQEPTFDNADDLERYLEGVSRSPRPMSEQEIRISALGLIFEFMPEGAELSTHILDDTVFPSAQHIADWITTGAIKKPGEVSG